MLSTTDAIAVATELAESSQSEVGEGARLDRIHRYLRDDPDGRVLEGLPAGAPQDVIRLARVSRINALKLILNTRVQGLYVDGFRTPTTEDDDEVMDIWQRNRMDARQLGVHRAGLAFGSSYVTVLPGQPSPVIRGYSPRRLTALYEDQADDWPIYALDRASETRWRLLDGTHVYELRRGVASPGADWAVVAVSPHGATEEGRPVCPVIRFRDTEDLDDPVRGIVEPHLALQDQINITTFGLLVAQHYGAFRQRYILGWLAKNEEEKLKASASKLWTFADHPNDVQVGEFQQTDLQGYIQSREASLRHLATVAQSPVPELLGELVNVSAEAFEGALASYFRAIGEHKTVMGESWEQVLFLTAEMAGLSTDAAARVVWRDTRVKSFREEVGGLVDLASGLGVPERELWTRVPSATQAELERWRNVQDAEEAEKAANPPPMPPPTPLVPSGPGQETSGEQPGESGA